ncbi:head decoration protein [Bremerella cremea]|uniref:head decoration protein n=1 Tax=Bremerella cremea TaxID=1031537 RepID=UPI0031ED4DAB
MGQFARGSLPGQSLAVESSVSQVQFLGPHGETNATILQGIIAASSVDAGNTPTTTLRAGLVLGRIAASGLLAPYDPTATNGTQTAIAILLDTLDMQDAHGVSEAKLTARILAAGHVVKSSVIGLTPQAQQQLIRQGIRFDQIPMPMASALCGHNGSLYATADIALTSSDNGKLVVASKAGAIAITLPAIEEGLEFAFVQTVDQNMTITSAEGNNVLAVNNAAADGIAFQTTSQKLGASVIVKAIRTASSTLKWIALSSSPASLTVVSA